MDKREIIRHIRTFFLEHPNRAQRHQFAGSLSKELNDLLLDFEQHFISYGIDTDPVKQLLLKYQLHSFEKEIKAIQSSFYLQVYDQAENDLPQAEDHLALVNARNESYDFLTNETAFENQLESILKNREQLTERVKELEKKRVEAENGSTPMAGYRPRKKRNLYRYISIAAILLLIFFTWQPFHKSDRELYSTYVATQKPLVFSKAGETNNEVRGNLEDALTGLTEVEKVKAGEAYTLYGNRSYTQAVTAFKEAGISATKGNQLLIALAISQLHAGELNNAAANLQSILTQQDTTQHDDARFYLALYHLKTGNRTAARALLKPLANKPGRYEKESNTLLNTMRWF
jgi:hypothetical protein